MRGRRRDKRRKNKCRGYEREVEAGGGGFNG